MISRLEAAAEIKEAIDRFAQDYCLTEKQALEEVTTSGRRGFGIL